MELMKQGLKAVLAAVLLWQPALAAPASMQVSKVKDDLTLTDVRGQELRLRDVVFPDKERARAWLEVHALHKDLEYTDQGKDRYGATLATTAAMEEAMLRDGVAMLYPQADAPKAWGEAEQAARANKKGVWTSKEFVLTPETAKEHLQEFRPVEGTITKMHVGKEATYINFGDDWKTDFTVQVRGRDRKALAEKLGQLAPGKKVQVRGTIYDENGAMVRLTRADQLMILQGGTTPPAPAGVPVVKDGDTVINVGFTNGAAPPAAVPLFQPNGGEQQVAPAKDAQ